MLIKSIHKSLSRFFSRLGIDGCAINQHSCSMVEFIFGLIIGCIAGAVIMSLCNASSCADKEMKKFFK